MTNGENLGMGIMNFIIGTMIWFSVLLHNFSKLLIVLLMSFVIINYVIAYYYFSKLYEFKKEVKTNGNNYSKKRS